MASQSTATQRSHALVRALAAYEFQATSDQARYSGSQTDSKSECDMQMVFYTLPQQMQAKTIRLRSDYLALALQTLRVVVAAYRARGSAPQHKQ